MKKTQILFLVSLIVLTALAISPEIAQAAPVVGNISFGGIGSPVPGPTWFQSTGVSFTNPWLVVGTSGDYGAIPFGTTSTFSSGNWGAGTGPVGPLATGIAWSLTTGGSTYTLTNASVTNIDRGNAGNDNISVVGTGTLTITGAINRDPTVGSWSFTGGFTSTGAPNLSFSSGAIPEPTTVLMFGSGLIALIVAKRLRKI